MINQPLSGELLDFPYKGYIRNCHFQRIGIGTGLC